MKMTLLKYFTVALITISTISMPLTFFAIHHNVQIRFRLEIYSNIISFAITGDVIFRVCYIWPNGNVTFLNHLR